MDASKEEADIQMSVDKQTSEDIIAEMKDDTTLSAAKKQALVDNVMKGRWFSQPLEEVVFE
ncbi:hypothetical protein ABPS01_06675 [Streptococcus sp. ZJ151]|uniref:hypothetical protein n=1 Tax=Streptococcus jiangjianxini TaxID=3161189 RepID=UPI0032ED55F4